MITTAAVSAETSTIDAASLEDELYRDELLPDVKQMVRSLEQARGKMAAGLWRNLPAHRVTGKLRDALKHYLGRLDALNDAR